MVITEVEQIKLYKNKIDPILYNNPQFEDSICKAIKLIFDRSKNRSAMISIADGGKSVTIDGQFVNPSIADLMSNNSQINSTTISVDDKGTMHVDLSEGTLVDARQYYSAQCAEDGKVDYEKLDKLLLINKGVTSLLFTYYTYDVIDKDGIGLSHSSFEDAAFPFVNNDVNPGMYDKLKSQVLGYHKPKYRAIDLELEKPICCLNATSEVFYRYYDNLGAVYCYTREKISSNNPGKTKGYICGARCEYPEILGAIKIGDIENGEYKNTLYPGLTDQEINKLLAEGFIRGLESSRTKEYGSPVLKRLQELADATAEKYDIKNTEGRSL